MFMNTMHLLVTIANQLSVLLTLISLNGNAGKHLLITFFLI